MFASPTIQIIIAVAIALVGFGGGWGVKGWKDTAKVAIVEKANQALEPRNAILETANGNCATDIEGVKSAVGVITKGVEEREKAASAAMRDAETLATRHKSAVAAIKGLPIVPQAEQCQVIETEQRDYVQARTQSSRK